MQQVNGVPVYPTDPGGLYIGLDEEPTWFSAQGGVYKCIERSTNRQVAIKKYLVEEDNPYGDMFVMPKELVENEIYSMTKCVHPNILKLYSVHLHLEFVYLVMPLCTGGSLQQYVFEHHLTIGQLVHIINSIASGLAVVHGNGYIHRDIKCDNIFLDEENNNIVIGDFGVVSISPAADSSVEEAGVVLFWSPELVQQKIINHKVDIWALGIVILEVLNGGKAPYEDEDLDEEEIKERILQVRRPAYPPDLPDLLVDLLDRCLDPEPRTRYSANNLLQHPFLHKYTPELLFPGTRIDQDISSQSESDPSEIMQDLEHDMSHISNKMEDIQCYDIKPLQQKSNQDQYIMLDKNFNSNQKAKCRLPLPAFSVDHSKSIAVPVKEKIANVIRKRQKMSDANRSQGCRIPMLCVPSPLIEEEIQPTPSEQPKLRSVRSGARLNTPEKLKKNPSPPKSPTSTNTRPVIDRSLKSPLRQLKPPSTVSTHQKPPIPKRSDLRSPLSDNKKQLKPKRELPPKCSVYRKRLPPAGESRTARLMMGLSATGRKAKDDSNLENEQVSRLKSLASDSPKRRPMSFASSISSTKSTLPSFHKSIPSPEISRTRQRQSALVPPKEEKHTIKKQNKDQKTNTKPLRVY